MTEIWKDIAGYDGLYKVSSLGNVKSLNYRHTGEEKILRQKIMNGYLAVNLCKDGKIKVFKIHRLVAEAFIPNPFHLPCINHKDENKHNNCVDNLEWCTQKYNINYGTAIKRRVEKRSIAIYCVELNKVFKSSVEAKRETGIHQGNITQCCKGRYKSAGGFHWQYADNIRDNIEYIYDINHLKNTATNHKIIELFFHK